MEASKLNPAPLDGYESAKPDEPIFTLQGGDPLAAPLVRLWAYLARVRTGLSGDVSWIDTPIYAAKMSSIEHDREACKDLLLRATQAEMVSWHMDGYRRGDSYIEHETRVDDLTQLDVYDVRRRTVALISNFFCNLEEYREKLIELKFIQAGDDTDNVMREGVSAIRSVLDEIEIQRGEKR